MANDAELIEVSASSPVASFFSSAIGRQLIITLGVAAIAAAMAGVWLWGQEPEYRVLLANFSDRDGGAIVGELQKMNVPYKYAEGGGAILVPAAQVHDTRLKLAAQGLPKGGNVGFELMSNQKMGVSQFLEQVNFQHALEGELARSIETIGSIQSARIHLALPKPTVFTREQQKPTASIIINLHPGRYLDQAQVNAIVHLVASSVPDLHPKGISVVDQNGNLLSEPMNEQNSSGPNPAQLKYIHDVQNDIVKRIESILTPIVGAGNVRAEATAEVDFSRSEQAAENYKPNPPPNTAIRSQQSSESVGSSTTASGIPGALSNQPQAPAQSSALINPQQPDISAAPQTPVNTHKDETTHYEVDKTVQYIQRPMGGMKRLTVAVVVNYRKPGDNPGSPAQALSDAETQQLNNLVKEAMGYSKERGDSFSIVNSPFLSAAPEKLPELPWWKQPENIALAKEVARYLLLGIIILVLYRRALKPLLARLNDVMFPPPPTPALPAGQEAGEVAPETGEPGLAALQTQLTQQVEAEEEIDELTGQPRSERPTLYQEKLKRTRELARNEPRLVAQIIQGWLNAKPEEEKEKVKK
ncbi:flagellar basal body M-ring protein FliF [Candidatus Methylospira mobilis]|uniref:Flagellar M-ring protein n=1 Tax=Candidatus Methylospira mobilis TaxID=1808979 RepID=A0A5Q0BIA7_9GAMM|nr:flagellar basal-body MS-ring/collar protein FliF [Candidatus Methylospira mobilis]QFY41868.1 flagellar basal body M-ring protein FliF [Candidatus Methylospira mobilis]WNV06745.1 flagellar basal-body MS-ring/collar protein FliF [Candidatus Methylospira mobilis]